MPEPDAVYSIDCEGRLVPGDRIRFNPGAGSGGHGDAPLIEAVVEKIEAAKTSLKDAVTLRVTASWGLDDPPTPGTSIKKERSTLSARGLQGTLEGRGPAHRQGKRVRLTGEETEEGPFLGQRRNFDVSRRNVLPDPGEVRAPYSGSDRSQLERLGPFPTMTPSGNDCISG